ncbi:unnamed protein product [Malus baccata var. baccata]
MGSISKRQASDGDRITALPDNPLTTRWENVQMGSMPKPQERVSDRISALPNEVLCHILSFLPTKYVVRTTVLSKKWNNIWTSVPNLYFCDDDYPNVNAFISFVDHVLDSPDLSRIQKFHLRCDHDYFEPPPIDRWIHSAIRRKVVELDLCVSHLDPDDNLELPQTNFMCETLEVLKLQFHFIAHPLTSRCFPNLKFLYVLIHHPDIESVKNVLSYLPVLEGLRIGGSLDDYDVESLDINISAPALKTLAICLEFDDFDEEFKICIEAPKLESLDVQLLTSLLNFSLLIKENLIVKANVDLSYTEMPNSDIADVEDILLYAEEPDRAIALLRNVSNVKYLSLSSHSLEGDLPAFDNLNQLKLVFYNCGYWRSLTNLLERSPNLEYLVFEHKDCTICNVEDFRHEFIPPEVVPISLSSQLKTININRFKGRRGEMELVKYLLKNGGVLNKMTIDASGNTNLPHARTKALSKEVSLFQRGSKTCQVEIRFGIS